MFNRLWGEHTSKHTAAQTYNLFQPASDQSTDYRNPKQELRQQGGGNNSLPVPYILKEFCQKIPSSHILVHAQADKHKPPAKIPETLLESLQELQRRWMWNGEDAQHTSHNWESFCLLNGFTSSWLGSTVRSFLPLHLLQFLLLSAPRSFPLEKWLYRGAISQTAAGEKQDPLWLRVWQASGQSELKLFQGKVLFCRSASPLSRSYGLRWHWHKETVT